MGFAFVVWIRYTSASHAWAVETKVRGLGIKMRNVSTTSPRTGNLCGSETVSRMVALLDLTRIEGRT